MQSYAADADTDLWHKAEIAGQPAASAASGTALLRITHDLRHRQLHDVNTFS